MRIEESMACHSGTSFHRFLGGVDFVFLLRASAIEQAYGSQLGVVNNAVAPWMWSLLSVIQYDRMANNIAKNFCPQPRGGATVRNPT